MPELNIAQARVIDPILSEHARGYVMPGLVGNVLFPNAPVRTYGGQILEFGKEGFRRYNTRRAPGADTARITFGYQGKPYAITPRALEAAVPDEVDNDAREVPQIDLASEAVETVLDAMNLDHEFDCAKIARDAGNYDADHRATYAGAACWGTDGTTSNPVRDIEVARDAIRGSIGLRANLVVLSAQAFSALQYHPEIIERMKYTGRDSVTAELLARLWDVQTVVVADAVGSDGVNNASDDEPFHDIWGTDVIVAYVSPGNSTGQRSMRRPSYGYTYQIRGNPAVEKPYRDNRAKSWIYGVKNDREPVLTGPSAGFLLQNIGGKD